MSDAPYPHQQPSYPRPQQGHPQPQPPYPYAQQPAYHPPAAGSYVAPHGPVPPAAPPAPRGSRTGVILALVAGLVLGAGVMTALALTGVVGKLGASDVVASDTSPISLPQTLPGLVLQVDAMTAKGAPTSGIDRLDKTRSSTVAMLAAAYSGAAVDVQLYSNSELDNFVTMHAIRAASSGLWLPAVQDAEILGLASAPRYLKQFGDVQCEIVTVVTVAEGNEVKPEDLLPSVCQRTDSTLTVRGFGSQGGTVDSMVAAVNAAWTAVR